MVDDEKYYDQPRDIYLSPEGEKRVRLWWRAVSRNPEFLKDFEEKVRKGRDEFHRLDEDTKKYFFEKYGIQFVDYEFTPRIFPHPEGKLYVGLVEGIGRYGVMLDDKQGEIDDYGPEFHPDWPNLIHLVINPRRPMSEIKPMVDRYYKLARSMIPKQLPDKKYERIDYERLNTAIDMWEKCEKEGKSVREIADEYYPRKDMEWQDERIKELEKEGKTKKEIDKIIKRERPCEYAKWQDQREKQLKKEGKTEKEINKIIKWEWPLETVRLKRVEEHIQEAKDLIMKGYRDLI